MTTDSLQSNSTPKPPEKPTRQHVRWTLAAIFLLAAVSIVGYGVLTRFGFLKASAVVAMLALFATCVWDRHLYWVPRLVLCLASTYLFLLFIDLGVWQARFRFDPALLLRGMYRADPVVGYRLNPNWRGVYEDPVVRGARYQINSLGHRDAEPTTTDAPRIFLLGDSFAFGSLLDQAETIDRQMERMSGGEIDVYNMGVVGFGTKAAANELATTTLPGRFAVYLFYENDLRNDGLATERNTVHRGFIVQTRDENGRAYTKSEMDARIDSRLSPARWATDAIRLRHLARLVRASAPFAALVAEVENSGDGHGPLDYNDANVARVVTETRALQELTKERDLAFVVAVVPSMSDVRAGRHADRVRAYVDGLRKADIPVIDPISKFSAADYYAHDGHFNPEGARKMATLLLAWVNDRSGRS